MFDGRLRRIRKRKMNIIFITLIPAMVIVFSVTRFIVGCGVKRIAIDEDMIQIAQISLIFSFTCLIGIEFYFYDHIYFSIFQWLVTMLFLIFYMIKIYGFYKQISLLIHLLERNGYKKVSDEVFSGYSKYGNQMPPRGFSKDLEAYRNALDDFNFIEISNDKELIEIQQKYRVILLLKKITISLFISWFLIPVIIIGILIFMK